MEQMNFHKQKLISLIVAGVALISLFLPWQTVSLGIFGGVSVNGIRGWGLLALAGVIGVAAAAWMGNKALPFDDSSKKIALASFGAIAVGALLTLVTKSEFTKAGIGLWVALVAGLAGLALLLGFVKIPEKGTTTTTTTTTTDPPKI